MSALKQLVIVGGGTAGWLTACLLAADHRAAHSDGLKVTLIESPNIPTIGVGEGTWPNMRDTLQRIGLSETAFLRQCQASFKQGSRFKSWVHDSPDDIYYHPFDAPPDEDEADAFHLWQSLVNTPGYEGADVASFAGSVGVQAALCAHNRAPKQVQTPEYAAVANYAYHLDAPAFARLLAEHGVRKLGIQHIHDDVVGAEPAENGHLVSVQTKQNGSVKGDIFIDCTGHRAALIGDHMRAEFTDVSHILFNDRALALPVPYLNSHAAIASQTDATAMATGWVWDIGLQTRRGVGHVFSSRHSGEEAARASLSAYLSGSPEGQAVDVNTARLLRFQPGYRKTPWVGNVVAIGMSQGFVEPLEATAIVLIDLAATMLSDILPTSERQIPYRARQFNERFAHRWTRIIEFLKLHYVLSQRDEPYWQAHRDPASWPKGLSERLEQWADMPPMREDFTHTQEMFPPASYAYILYGMGFQTQSREYKRRKDEATRVRRLRDEISARRRLMLERLPSHRDYLEHVSGQVLIKAS